MEKQTNINAAAILRPVKAKPGVESKDTKKTGVIFESLESVNCPHCKIIVPLAATEPLSWLICPKCEGKILSPGQVDGFLLHGHIGEGEMGTIYQATDESLEREVAIKLVRGCHIDDPESRERLQREACAAGKLNHPRVAQVHALNFSNGHPYLVMELVTGEDFARKLEQEGHIDERTALRMAADVADGLSALNREGLVHGDIKPGNIVLDRDGNAKLVDFGLSGMKRLDNSGTLIGTPNYIAPEMLRGAADTHLSDIYSLGSTLYHLLSGKLPFEGESANDILKARMFKQPAHLGRQADYVSLPTQKLVMKMIESNPETRQANSDIVASEIKEALAQLDPPMPKSSNSPELKHDFSKPPKSPKEHPIIYSRRRPSAFFIILCLIAVIELLVAIKESSFSQTWEWLRTDAAGHLRTIALSTRKLLTKTTLTIRDKSTAKAGLNWKSINLGEHTKRGSTMQVGGAIVLQGTGKDMWKGYDNCRFISTKISSNYVFSAQIQMIAQDNDLDISGMLIKGNDPARGPGLLFGFLGSGQLVLQTRIPNNPPEVIKSSRHPIRPPGYLKIIRRGSAFETCFSSDGRVWEDFATCELTLPSKNTIGLCVSPQQPESLATAKFANINVLPLNLSDAAQTNNVQVVK